VIQTKLLRYESGFGCRGSERVFLVDIWQNHIVEHRAGGFSGSPLSEGSRASLACICETTNWNGKYVDNTGRPTHVFADANDVQQQDRLVDVSRQMCIDKGVWWINLRLTSIFRVTAGNCSQRTISENEFVFYEVLVLYLYSKCTEKIFLNVVDVDLTKMY
jgi:hypothetical protein